MRKAIKFLNDAVDIGFFFVCIIIFLIGLYAMADSYLVYREASGGGLYRFEGEDREEVKKKIKGNMVAWITLDDTDVDYPVMQGEDNSEYLNKNPYGEYALSGSIFLDSRNAPDFTDPYSLIYGHHMQHGAMFGALDAYLDEGYFRKHEKGVLETGGTRFRISAFAVVETAATNDAVFAPTEHDDKTMPFVRERALFLEASNLPGPRERVLALSTCKFPETVERTIVFFTIREELTQTPSQERKAT